MANGQSVLSRVGQGLISFASGIPQVEIDQRRANVELTRNQAGLQEQQLEANEVAILREQAANEAAILKEQERQRLIPIIQAGGPNAQSAANEFFINDPDAADQLLENIAVRTDRQREELARRADNALAIPFGPERDQFLRASAVDIIRDTSEGQRNPNDTLDLIGLPQEEQELRLRMSLAATQTGAQRVARRGEIPTTRTRIEGEESIVEQFNPTTRQFEEISRGPRGVLQRIEQGPPGSFGDLTDPQRGKIQVEAQNAAIATVNALNTATDLIKLAASNRSILGNSGDFFRIANDLAQTAVGIAQVAGIEFDNPIEEMTNPDNYTFRGTAVDSAVLQSGITSLAFAAAAASGQEGKSVSDKDVQRFINEIGGSISDPVAFQKVMNAFTKRLARGFSTRIRAQQLDRPDLVEMIDEALSSFSAGGVSGAVDAAATITLEGFDQLTPEQQARLTRLKELERQRQ